MHTPYLRVRCKVLVTMFSTIAIMLANAIINILGSSKVKFAIFTIYVTVGHNEPETRNTITQASLEFFIYAFEVFLLWFTTQNINFKIYVFNLMVGVNQAKNFAKMSIFLIHIPGNSLEDSQDSAEFIDNDATYQDKSDNEDIRKRLIDYDSQSNVTCHTVGGFSVARPIVSSDMNLRLSSHEVNSIHKSQPILSRSD